MDDAKQQAIERIKQANNVLVTVSNNPSVDQLSACIGLTLILNKLGKHATAVYSGQTPSIIEFLQPEKTIEKNTDSLRDFIIALDKSKADKLRYKVEDKVVKIFITPYRTSISKDDLDFSQGDFNVDVVIGLGVHQQADLDQAITAHGRILHDATVITLNVTPNGDLGNINWQDPSFSSLSELVETLVAEMGSNLLDNQIATALLTGIVAATNRFSNDKTSARTMSVSSQLIAAGANQQLVASKLDQPAKVADKPTPPNDSHVDSPPAAPVDVDQPAAPSDDGAIAISHDDENSNSTPAPPSPAPPASQINIDEHGNIMGNSKPANQDDQPAEPAPQSEITGGAPLITEPPVLGGQPGANYPQNEDMEPSTDPFSLPAVEPPLLNREPLGTNNPPSSDPNPTPPADEPRTLTQIEEAVHSPHLSATEPEPEQRSSFTDVSHLETEQNDSPHEEESHIDDARDAVQAAINSSPETQPLEPVQSLNAQPVFDSMNDPTPNQADNPLPPLPLTPPDNPMPPLPTTPTEPPSPQSFISPQDSSMPPQDSLPDQIQPDPIDTFNMPMPQQPLQPFSSPSQDDTPSASPSFMSNDTNNPPPPVPPPMMPPVL